MTAADEFYEAALRIADRKLDREGPFGPVLRPTAWNRREFQRSVSLGHGFLHILGEVSPGTLSAGEFAR